VELVLKERLRRVHPRYVWRDLSAYPRAPALTVGCDKALERLTELCDIEFTKEDQELLREARELRNAVAHGAFIHDAVDAKELVGVMLAFVFRFARRHLGTDLEAEFGSTDGYQMLHMVYEFWLPHALSLEEDLRQQGYTVSRCWYCVANTYVIEESRCALCGATEAGVECPRCEQIAPASEVVTLDSIGPDGVVEPVHFCCYCLPQAADDEKSRRD
jgi:hypothetical protein